MSSTYNMRGALRPQAVARGRRSSVAVMAHGPEQVSSRRSFMAGTIAIGLASMAPSAQAAFLKSTGARCASAPAESAAAGRHSDCACRGNRCLVL